MGVAAGGALGGGLQQRLVVGRNHVERALAQSLVRVQFTIPYRVDGLASANYLGTGSLDLVGGWDCRGRTAGWSMRVGVRRGAPQLTGAVVCGGA